MTATVTVIATIFYAPRRVLETWDWYWDRFRDGDVFYLIERQKSVAAASVFRDELPISNALSVKELADFLGRSESSVRKSVTRLRRREKVEPFQDGWRLKTKG